MRQRTMDATISPAQSPGPLPAYRAQVEAGHLVADPSQRMAAERRQNLWVKLRGYDPPPKTAAVFCSSSISANT